MSVKLVNEFRQDLVSGEWVLLAAGRAARPDLAAGSQAAGKCNTAENPCPFENPEASGNEVLQTYFLPDQKTDWFAKIIKNKYPAVLAGDSRALNKTAGPFSVMEAKGTHELVVFRGHDRQLHDFSVAELEEVLRIYQERYISTAQHNLSRYILIFHNKGASAGASVNHPHSQIISLPILPPDVARSLGGSERFYQANQKRVYDVMLEWERAEGKRIVTETENFIAFCPFVSKTPYEVRIFSKESHAHFDQLPGQRRPELAQLMLNVLGKFNKLLTDPDFNFFIHTAPVESTVTSPHAFYSWHIEFFPKLSRTGGFELGSGIQINVMNPNEAAAQLRAA